MVPPPTGCPVGTGFVWQGPSIPGPLLEAHRSPSLVLEAPQPLFPKTGSWAHQALRCIAQGCPSEKVLPTTLQNRAQDTLRERSTISTI